MEGVEEAFLQRNYGGSYGQLYKPDSMEMGKEGFQEGNRTPQGMGASMGNGDVLLQYIDDEPESYSNIFDNVKTKADEEDKERLIGALKKLSSREGLEKAVDVDSVLRYFVAHNFVLNFDSYTGTMVHNYYLYEEDGQLSMIPWDYNLAFGGFESGGSAETLINFPIDTPVSGGSIEERPMLSWIFADEVYTGQYHQYFSELVGGYFESGRFAEELEAVKAMISPYVEEDPTKFCTYDEFLTGIDTLKEFCLLRAESIRGQLDGAIGTEAGEQDTATFVAAGDIEVSDMGAMNNSAGIGGRPQEGLKDSGEGFPQGEVPDGMPPGDGGGDLNGELPEGVTEGTPGGNPPGIQKEALGEGMPGRWGEIPASQDGIIQQGEKTENQNIIWVLTGLSAGVLIVGILVAFFFKQR